MFPTQAPNEALMLALRAALSDDGGWQLAAIQEAISRYVSEQVGKSVVTLVICFRLPTYLPTCSSGMKLMTTTTTTTTMRRLRSGRPCG